jgi:SPP1 family predicted phage head-tail adaptor
MAYPTIGEMNKRLKIWPLLRTGDGAGGWTVKGGQPFDIWAKIRQPNGREVVKYQAQEREIDTIIETRYYKEITKGSTAQLTERGLTRNFKIDLVIDEEQEYRFLKIEAREVF